MSSIAVGKVMGTAVIKPKEQGRVFLLGSGAEQLSIEQIHQSRWRDARTVREAIAASPTASQHGCSRWHAFQKVGTNGGVDRSHQERSRNSLSRNISHR